MIHFLCVQLNRECYLHSYVVKVGMSILSFIFIFAESTEFVHYFCQELNDFITDFHLNLVPKLLVPLMIDSIEFGDFFNTSVLRLKLKVCAVKF